MSNQSMDYLPLIPGRESSQNATRPLRAAFQDILDGELYPKKIAECILNSQSESDLGLRENAEQVLKIYDSLDDDLENIEAAGRQVMEQHGSYLLRKDRIENIQHLKERIRLQHCYLFKNLNLFYVDHFGLLQKSDLLPDVIKHYLDYRLNPKLHLCTDCLKKCGKMDTSFSGFSFDVARESPLRCSKNIEVKRCRIYRNKEKRCEKLRTVIKQVKTDQQEKKESKSTPFTITPKEVQFHNCEVGKTYKKAVRLLNISSFTQSLVTRSLPKDRSLSVYLNIMSKLASGMSCTATIIYKPEVHRNINDSVSFRNQQGYEKILPIRVTRVPPRLITCIFKSNSYRLNRPKPGSPRFSEARREALNSSIDCGSCLVGEYVYLSLFVQNKGMAGKFFLITEDEWYFENIETISTSMEYSNDCLWIYPTYFELNPEETTEIHILFFPSIAEMFLEKFYLMCDNNSFQILEVLGDGLLFNKHLINIDVPPNDTNINRKEDYCIILGGFQPNSSTTLTFTVHNTSALFLKCYWKLENRKIKDVNQLEKAWVDMANSPNCLAPYSTTDFEFKINLDTSKSGYCNIFFSFIVADVPVISLEKDVNFLIIDKKEPATMLPKCVDVYIMEIEVVCFIEELETETTDTSDSESTYHEKPITRKSKIAFSTYSLEFGILPNGLPVTKAFWVKNLSFERTKWKIIEVKYNIDTPPFMEIINLANINQDAGEFSCACEKIKIQYSVTEKGPLSWVSVLLLISLNADETFEIESLCIVTYEIINYDITINGYSEDPVLCPLQILYTGVPHTLTITVENHSPITGIFYFLKPYGKGTQTVQVEIDPLKAILGPLQSKSVELKITSNNVGIYENIFIPCFVNKGQPCIISRLLCAVDGVHMAVYLPGQSKCYDRIIWPPKLLFDYDDDWMICPCTLEFAPEFESSSNINKDGTGILPTSSNDVKMAPGNNTPVLSDEVMIAERSLDNSKSETDPSSNSNSKSSNESLTGNLKNKLKDEFGDELFLQDHVVEVHNVPLKTPKNVTFYLENITPVPSRYTVEAMNFYTTKTFDKLASKFKRKKPEDIWNEMIMNEYGILVLPDVKEDDVPGSGLIEVNLTIFSNTWGIYQEEIAVDIADLPCFTFSLLIEVVGSPVVFPMALCNIRELPTLNFGNVAYCSEESQRQIKIANTSVVPLKILWHVFLKASSDTWSKSKFNIVFDVTSKLYIPKDVKLNITDTYYGMESHNLFQITPYETKLEENSFQFLDVRMTPENFPSKPETTYARCSLVGRIFVEEKYRMKTNYFLRDTDLENSNHVRMEILVTMEMPILRMDFISGDTIFRFYANEVIFEKDFKERSRLIFQNNHTSASEVEMKIEEPFEILDGQKEKDEKHVYMVQPLSSLEITLNCKVDHQKILNLSQIVYIKKDVPKDEVAQLKSDMRIKSVNNKLKILHIQRHLKILHKGGTEKLVPIDVYIHFPYISVDPAVLRLDQVFLSNTRKALITVFNHTGYPISFEIFKTLASDVLVVTPHYGRIEKTTGVNKSFVNVFIYFTPSEVRQYQESIRVVTNIPNYFIEVPIKASGTINEKFYRDYSI